MDRILLNEDIFFGWTVGSCVYFSYCTICIILPGVVFGAIYRYIRPKLPAKVNCWFCNRNTLVPFNTRNCWDCPHCDQYNGFNDDGDYNIDIRKKMLSSTSNAVTPSPEKEPTNGLCHRCNVNQRLKIQQLARFKPINENNFDDEADSFREQLDKCYKLCESCEKVLHKTLRKQKVNLLTNRMNDHRKKDTGTVNGIKTIWKPSKFQMFWGPMLKKMSFGLLVLIIISTVISFYKTTLLDILELDKSDVETLTQFFKPQTFFISACGAVLYMASNYGTATRKSDACLCLWFLMTVLSVFDLPGLLFVSSVLTFLFHGQTLKSRTQYFPRKDFIKMTVTEDIIPPVQNDLPNLNDVVEKSLKKDIKAITTIETVKGNEKDQEPNFGKRFEVHKIELTPSKIITRSMKKEAEIQISSPKKVSELSGPVLQEKVGLRERYTSLPPEIGKIEVRQRHFSPPPEVYEGLFNLHLSPISAEIDRKAEKQDKKSSGLIKPAKFVPSLTAPDTSSSCTPQSVAPSSASSHFIKDRLNEDECNPKIISSDSCNQISPFYNKFSSPYACSFDCNEYNNFNNAPHSFCFPGFSPYQMYSTPMGAMGHTAVYTYTRPSPFPYAFPQQRFTPPYDFLPPMSPKISEINKSNSSGNLFLSQSGDRWSWLKQCAFAVCVLSAINIFGWVTYFYAKTDLFSF